MCGPEMRARRVIIETHRLIEHNVYPRLSFRATMGSVYPGSVRASTDQSQSGVNVVRQSRAQGPVCRVLAVDLRTTCDKLGGLVFQPNFDADYFVSFDRNSAS